MRRPASRSALALACVVAVAPGCATSHANRAARHSSDEVRLRIATFNVQVFGPTKASRPKVLAQLAEVIRQYDLVAVQEVCDVSGDAPRALLAMVNDGASRAFSMLLSPRSGREPDDRFSQEQYVYYYRGDRLRPLGGHGLFDDSQHDYFQREPHVARFEVHRACQNIVLINVHTRPDSALAEIAAVEHVFAWAAARYSDETRFIALGDFNAGCGYASEHDLRALPLHGKEYTWVIPHSADTNLARASCPYDRIIVRAPEGSLLVESWGVDRSFDDRAVSDHWPVWAELAVPIPAACPNQL